MRDEFWFEEQAVDSFSMSEEPHGEFGIFDNLLRGPAGPPGPQGPQGEPGNYTKPDTGIPKTDLASDVQASLDKADTALQQHQSLDAYRTAAAQDEIDAGKQAKITASGMLKGNGSGGVSAATDGTDYLAPSALNSYRTAAAQDEIDAGKASTSIIAVPFSGTTHNVGDYVIYNGNLYRCTQYYFGGWNANYWAQIIVSDEIKTAAKPGDIAFVINGNTCASNVAVGQYVILRNSTINGKTDGLYTAAKAISANTAIDGTYLEAVSDGGLNAILDTMQDAQTYSLTPESGFSVATGWGFCNLAVFGKIAIISGGGVSASGSVTNADAFKLPKVNGVQLTFRNKVLAPLAYGVSGVAYAPENGAALKMSFANGGENGVFNLVALLN